MQSPIRNRSQINGYRVKICGNVYLGDSLRVAAQRPDYMGWIFSPRSARRVSADAARLQIHEIRLKYPEIRHVGVFAFNPAVEVRQIWSRVGLLDYLQIADGAGYQDALCRMAGFRRELLWPVLRVRRPVALADQLRFCGSPMLLVDAYDPVRPGGTGRQVPTEFLGEMRRPFLLAGGLRPENVASALQATAAIGADVASGVEVPGQPGRKDPGALRAFIEIVRGL